MLNSRHSPTTVWKNCKVGSKKWCLVYKGGGQSGQIKHRNLMIRFALVDEKKNQVFTKPSELESLLHDQIWRSCHVSQSMYVCIFECISIWFSFWFWLVRRLVATFFCPTTKNNPIQSVYFPYHFLNSICVSSCPSKITRWVWIGLSIWNRLK